MRYIAPLLVALLLCAAMPPAPAAAQPFRARQGVQSGEVRSLNEILNGIRRERPGNLADVQGPNIGPAGDPRYRLKWLTPDGRVLWLDTDARTGRVLGVEGDDRGPSAASRGGFIQRRGNFQNGPPVAPPPGYDRGPPVAPPPGYDRGPPPGYDRGPPPGYDRGPPPGYNRGAPPAYDRGPPPGYDRGGPPTRGPDRGARGRFRFER
jgi:hypothetical protein